MLFKCVCDAVRPSEIQWNSQDDIPLNTATAMNEATFLETSNLLEFRVLHFAIFVLVITIFRAYFTVKSRL